MDQQLKQTVAGVAPRVELEQVFKQRQLGAPNGPNAVGAGDLKYTFNMMANFIAIFILN